MVDATYSVCEPRSMPPIGDDVTAANHFPFDHPPDHVRLRYRYRDEPGRLYEHRPVHKDYVTSLFEKAGS